MFSSWPMKPIILDTIKNYDKQKAVNDVIAGILVGIIAIPLSIALAIASGTTPETGLWTAALAGFVVALLGGSAVQVSGPTGAFVVIVYGIIQQHGYSGLVTATLLAGILIIILGLCRAGSLIKFIPYPITIGFTAGIAVTLFAGQIGDFSGMHIENLPADFFGKVTAYIANIDTVNGYTLLVGCGSLLLIVLWNRWNRYIPGSLVALVLATAATALLHLPVETIGTRFGSLSSELPKFTLPRLDIKTLSSLVGPALSIAVLGSIESLLSAVVADGMTGKKHNSNMELVAQGVGNIFSSIFGGLPVTGAIARTAANIRNGGKTPVAAILHSITILICTLIFMPLVKHIPMTALSAILFTVCYNMIEWRSIKELFRAPKSDIVVLLTTFVFTVVFDLVIAIQIGLLLAMLLFIKRMVEVTDIVDITSEALDEEQADFILPKELIDKVIVYQVQGPFFFGAANSFLNVENRLSSQIRAIVFCMDQVPAMDATGIHALLVFLHTCRRHKVEVFLVGARQQPMRSMQKGRILEMVNQHHIYDTKEEALEYILSVSDHLINMHKHPHVWHRLHDAAK